MFNDIDRALHKGLMKILDDATFPLKAREVDSFKAVYRWAQGLMDKKPEIKVKEPPKPLSSEELGEEKPKKGRSKKQ